MLIENKKALPKVRPEMLALWACSYKLLFSYSLLAQAFYNKAKFTLQQL